QWCARSPGGAVGGKAAQEQAIDLQLVDRQLTQVGKARIAGAEVVDREAHAEAADLAQGRGVLTEVRHQHPLGDLELEAGTVERIGRERALQALDRGGAL